MTHTNESPGNPGRFKLSVTLLNRLNDAPNVSQRELARDTGVSLGKLNFALRALIDKGWVKVGNFSRNPNKLSYAYLLTPAGVEAKLRLTRSFPVAPSHATPQALEGVPELRNAVPSSRCFGHVCAISFCYHSR